MELTIEERINNLVQKALDKRGKHPKGFDNWAKKWLSGEDRTADSAKTICDEVYGKFTIFNHAAFAAFNLTPPRMDSWIETYLKKGE
jgi:hypothetical protein